MKVRIGTRGSRLALWQAYHIQDLLKSADVDSELEIIETKGDKILDRSLSKIGSKGIFTQELEDQLRAGTIDIAVHSAKDMQSSLAEDLSLIAFTDRERVNDVLLSHDKSLSLKDGRKFVVGTSSARRVAMLKHFHPHITTVDMRGNLQTRLRKLEEGQCDALLLAYAGVHRMEYDNMIAEFLPTHEFTPAVGQGSIAVEAARTLPDDKLSLIRQLTNHEPTEACLRAERSFLRRLEGGCSIPVFGLATLLDGELTLTGGVVSTDGSELLRDQFSGPVADAEQIGHDLAESILARGGDEILRAVRQNL